MITKQKEFRGLLSVTSTTAKVHLASMLLWSLVISEAVLLLSRVSLEFTVS